MLKQIILASLKRVFLFFCFNFFCLNSSSVDFKHSHVILGQHSSEFLSASLSPHDETSKDIKDTRGRAAASTFGGGTINNVAASGMS